MNDSLIMRLVDCAAEIENGPAQRAVDLSHASAAMRVAALKLTQAERGAKLQPDTATLRDQFAMTALSAIYAGNTEYPDENWRMGLAMDAYEMADAMLAARKEAA